MLVGYPHHFPHVELDAFVIMPNHIHEIVLIGDDTVIGDDTAAENRGAANVGAANVGAANVGAANVGAKNFSPLRAAFRSPSRTIGSIVRGFKIGATKWFRANTDIHDLWQRNFYERVIRNEGERDAIRRYIADNPAKWVEDENHPAKC